MVRCCLVTSLPRNMESAKNCDLIIRMLEPLFVVKLEGLNVVAMIFFAMIYFALEKSSLVVNIISNISLGEKE